jgi:hypothetical protein
MKPKSPHIPVNELLQLADDELSVRSSAALQKHLAVCPLCAGRLAEIEHGLGRISTIYREARPEAKDAAGPRALLRARLADERERNLPADVHWLPATLTARNLAFVCLLALLTGIGYQALHRPPDRGALMEAGPLPNPAFTPGSTRQASLTDLCATDDEEVVRSVPRPIEQEVLEEYGIQHMPATDFEVDYLIAPGLGGSDDVKNLWPEPHSNTLWNSYVKDRLEDRLHRMVCEKKIPLEQAQRDIASNWIAAYKKYFQTDQPLSSTPPASATEVAALQ